jgi:hypothetical protein
MAIDPARRERERYLIELLDTTNRMVERTVKRLEHEYHEDQETFHLILRELREIRHNLEPHPSPPTSTFATAVSFKETSMLSTTGGNTLVYTGTLSPAGSGFAPDATFSVSSNDPSVLPTVDATGLVVTVPLPSDWVESTSVALAVSYASSSVSTGQALTATITPSAPISPTNLATSVTFNQTT